MGTLNLIRQKKEIFGSFQDDARRMPFSPFPLKTVMLHNPRPERSRGLQRGIVPVLLTIAKGNSISDEFWDVSVFVCRGKRKRNW
jgi:hypothetical protein